MKKNMIGMMCCVVLAQARSAPAAEIGTAFTYQGYLEKPAGTPLTDTCDFEFSLWDDADPSPPENQIGSTQVVSGVVVSGGVFTVGPPDIDFGAGAIDGDARWLEIHLKCPPDVAFTMLLPRVELTPSPHAVRAVSGVGGPEALNVASGGSVGIGTDSPAPETRVHVQAGSDGIGVLTDVAGAPGGRIGLRTSSVGYAELVKNAYFDFGDLTWKRFDTGTGAFVLECEPDGDVMFGVAEEGEGPISWNYAMTLKAADGSVGVGTDTPEAPLHVQEGSAGAVTADARSVVIVERNDHAYLSLLTPSNTERGILFGDQNNNASGAIIYNPDNVFNPNSMQFRTGGGVPQMVIDDNGNVGIGTTGPDLDTRLHVQARSDDFGVLVDADGESGSEIGLHTATTGYASLVKNAWYDEAGATGWYRFRSSMGTFLEEVAPNGDTTFRVAGTGLGAIAWKDAITLQSSSGNVGVGRSPSANKLEVEGDASKTVAGSWLANSDQRIKQNVTTITGALETLDKARLVTFEYTDAYRKKHPSIKPGRYMNVIAQEFAEVFPGYVKSSGEHLSGAHDSILQADTYPLTIYSAAAIQELHRQVKDQERLVEELRSQKADLEARVTAVESMIRSTLSSQNGGGR